jgi:tetratricopeptide (TPR) repeat protein
MPTGRRPQPARRRGPGARARPTSRKPGVERKAPKKTSIRLAREAVQEIQASAGSRAPQVVTLLEEAVEALDKGRPSDAIATAERAKSMASRSASVREILALALYRAERYKDVIREVQAYRRMTGRADQNHILADAFRATGAPDRAVPLAEEAMGAPVPVEIRAEAAVVAGSALADMGRYEQALALLRRYDRDTSTAHEHDLRIWYVIADVLERAGRRSEAVDRFKRILAHDPDAYDVAERLAALT